jgi:hypothetical protein
MLTLLLAWWRSRRLVGSPTGQPTYVVHAADRNTPASAVAREYGVAARPRHTTVTAS